MKLFLHYRFADEREWRFVQEFSSSRTALNFLNDKDIRNDSKREEYNNLIKDKRLNFDPKDILYIIVKEEREIETFIKHIKKVKDTYSEQDIDRLMTRIISCERILLDF